MIATLPDHKNFPSEALVQDFTVTPAQALAWHRREAEACVKEQNPAAALFHTLHACDPAWAVSWGWPRW